MDGQPPPTLRGDRVVLRPLEPGDRDALFDMLAEPDVGRWWAPRGAEVAADELYDDETTLRWAITLDGLVCGFIQAHEETDPMYRHAGIDLFVGSAWQGRGLGSDAIRTVARMLIRDRGHHRLVIDPAADNKHAIRAYTALGFRPVGRMRQYEQGPDGTFHDGLLMDMLADELR